MRVQTDDEYDHGHDRTQQTQERTSPGRTEGRQSDCGDCDGAERAGDEAGLDIAGSPRITVERHAKRSRCFDPGADEAGEWAFQCVVHVQQQRDGHDGGGDDGAVRARFGGHWT